MVLICDRLFPCVIKNKGLHMSIFPLTQRKKNLILQFSIFSFLLCMNLVLGCGSAAAGNRLILALEFLQEACFGPGPYFDVLCASACQDCVIKICIIRVLLVCILHVEYGAKTHTGWYQAWFHKLHNLLRFPTDSLL